MHDDANWLTCIRIRWLGATKRWPVFCGPNLLHPLEQSSVANTSNSCCWSDCRCCSCASRCKQLVPACSSYSSKAHEHRLTNRSRLRSTGKGSTNWHPTEETNTLQKTNEKLTYIGSWLCWSGSSCPRTAICSRETAEPKNWN